MGGTQSVASQPTSTFNIPPAPVTEVPVTSMQSVQGHVNGDDFKGLVITAGLFALGAGITSLSTSLNVFHLSETQTLLVTIALGTVGKFIQKLLDGPKV